MASAMHCLEVDGCSDDDRRSDDKQADKDDEDAQNLQQHFQALRRHFENQVEGFGELDLLLSDLAELHTRCLRTGVGAAVLEALDEAMAMSEDGELGAQVVCSIDVEEENLDQHSVEKDAHTMQRRADVLACMGDYFALFRCIEAADLQYRAALKADSDHLIANLGHTRILAERLASNTSTDDEDRQNAYAAAWRCLDSLELAAEAGREIGDAAWERRVCQCFHVLDDITKTAVVRDKDSIVCDSLHLLARAILFVQTSAASAIECLARRFFVPPPWYPQLLDFSDGVSEVLPDCIMALLVHSRTFCCASLEKKVAHWRNEISTSLSQIFAEAGNDGKEDLGIVMDSRMCCIVRNAAALACHLFFVGYCVPLNNSTTETEAFRTALLVVSNAANGKNHHLVAVAWLLAAMYENPPAEAAKQIEHLLLVGGACGDILGASGEDALRELFDRCVHQSCDEVALAEILEELTPGRTAAASTPCIEFYAETVYPPWHKAVDSAGSTPIPINDRLRQLFPWHKICPPKRNQRILIAGCGSGHQIVVELRTYANCEVVALDCSSRSVAHAQRKLKSVLSESDFKRVRFIVGDIMDLHAGAGIVEEGFDLVICCGVLHHLLDPPEGLRRLASVLTPGGILQLATYSRLSVEGWHNLVLSHLRSSHDSKHLFSSTGNVLRSPTREEVRNIRATVLSLPAGNELRDNLMHFEEFYTYAGILDLLFHPLETCYTLIEIQSILLRPARLHVVGVFFPDVNNDLRARRRFREKYDTTTDLHMTSLERWHALETQDPDLFGRMHTMFLQRDDDASKAEGVNTKGVTSSSAPEKQDHEENLNPSKRLRTGTE